jgi:hypothetical protein
VINTSGTALLTGKEGTNGYYALVSPTGILSPYTIELANSNPLRGAINNNGSAIIGGQLSNSGYVARVAPDGGLTPIPLENVRIIDSVALNTNEVALVGGEGAEGLFPYAAFVEADGTVRPIRDITSKKSGRIASVALNEYGEGIVGGHADADTYVAFVLDEGTFPLSPLPAEPHYIQGVAINDYRQGLIVGTKMGEERTVYAATVSPGGILTSLFDDPFQGELDSVDMNGAGVGVIGGRRGSNLYAARVRADGTVVPVFEDVTPGKIEAVAISESEVSLLCGHVEGFPYAALVAPDGTLTHLDVTHRTLMTRATATPGGLDQAVTPTSISFAASTPYLQLAATSALEARFTYNNAVWQDPQNGPVALQHTDFLTSTSEKSPLPQNTPLNRGRDTVWLEPFATLLYVDADGNLPRFRNSIAGGLLGYDYRADTYMVGAAAGYGYNRILLSQHLGDGHLHQGLASLYGAYYSKYVWIGGAMSVGGYSLTSRRTTLGSLESTGQTHGWVASPRIELASPWPFEGHSHSFFEPFIAFDWVGNWQNAYTETGPSGLNVEMPDVRNSLLQIEAGLRFYQCFGMYWGAIRLEEKVSYINQNPSDTTNVSASFVGATSSFPVAVSRSRVENLVSGRMSATFMPNQSNLPYGGGAIEAALNSQYQSYFFSLFVGYEF